MPRPSSREGLSPSRTKTKSGCLTCKKRRIKCDEAKPHCLKCTSTGRKCDGYGAPGTRSSNSAVRLPIHLPPILKISGSERENRSFQFFYERTVPSLSGYCGSEFWNRLVLQVSQHEKSIWHALIALGSLHENFENDQQIPGLWFSRQGRDPFAVQEYVSAIRALLGPPDAASRDVARSANLTVDVCLISCVLFACFEILSSHYDSAIRHIRSGIKIFNEVHYDPNLGIFCHPFLKPSTVTNLEMESLWRMLIRLQSQAFTLTREDIDKQLFHSSPGRHSQYIEIPEAFRSIAEARDIFEYYTAKFSYDVREMVGDEEAQPSSAHITLLRSRYEPLLGRWSIALENFERQRGQHLTPREKNGLKILKIHQFMQFILLEYSKLGDPTQTPWDKFNPMFEKVIDLAASVVDSTHGVECLSLSPSQLAELSRGGRLRPSFSLDMGIVSSLYNVAALCRDPIIRRKAVSVLRSASLQEGVFNSHVCAVFAEQIIAIEETVASGKPLDYQTELSPLTLLSGLKEEEEREITESSQVPDTARLSYAYPTVNTTDKKVFLTFGRGKAMHVDIPLPAMTAMLDMES